MDLDGDSVQTDVRLETAKEDVCRGAEGSSVVDLDHDALEFRTRENVEQRCRLRCVELVVAEIDPRDTVRPRERCVVHVLETIAAEPSVKRRNARSRRTA
jgi:hypothetical protein